MSEQSIIKTEEQNNFLYAYERMNEQSDPELLIDTLKDLSVYTDCNISFNSFEPVEFIKNLELYTDNFTRIEEYNDIHYEYDKIYLIVQKKYGYKRKEGSLNLFLGKLKNKYVDIDNKEIVFSFDNCIVYNSFEERDYGFSLHMDVNFYEKYEVYIDTGYREFKIYEVL
jgi:hypothetical protein